MDQQYVADRPPGPAGGVLRPTPTLPTAAAPMAAQTSGFQEQARAAAMIAEVGASLPAPHPRDGGSAGGVSPTAELFQTTSEDELAATTVGLLSSRAGPSQLNRQRSHDSNNGHDELSRPTAPALHASQQAMLQQQVQNDAPRMNVSHFEISCQHLISPHADQLTMLGHGYKPALISPPLKLTYRCRSLLKPARPQPFPGDPSQRPLACPDLAIC